MLLPTDTDRHPVDSRQECQRRALGDDLIVNAFLKPCTRSDREINDSVIATGDGTHRDIIGVDILDIRADNGGRSAVLGGDAEERSVIKRQFLRAGNSQNG